jgi:hypothetical protein
MAEWNQSPWARWKITYTIRGSQPVLTETNLWDLQARHPEAVEPVGDGTWFVYLDQPYRVRPVEGRAYFTCEPAPGRTRAAPAPKPGGF